MNENNTMPQEGDGAGNSGKKLWYIVGGVAILVIVGWVFSGGLARNAAERALDQAGVDVDYKLDGTATYSTDEGTVTVGGTSYPDDWPSDAPRYPGGEIVFSGSSNPETGSSGATVSFTTKDSPSKVIDYYKRELQSKGWQIESANTAGMMIVSATKADNSFGVWAVEANGITQVTAGVGM